MLRLFGRGYLKNRKIQSSSLSYALFTIIIIGIILSVVILLVSANNNVFTKRDVSTSLVDKELSVLEYAKNNLERLEVEFQELELEGAGEVWLRKRKWGILNLLEYKVIFRKDTFKKAFFIESISSDSTAITLLKNDKGFFLGGDSKIEGDIRVPFKEINRLDVAGYVNKFIHKGVKKEAVEKLPDIKKESIPREVVYISESQMKKEKKNSFFKKTKKVSLELESVEGLTLLGNYVLESKKGITIKSNNILEDIIVKSPVVRVEKGFRGAIQILASDRIIIEENVLLEYPSILYAYGESGEVNIEIKKNSKILGGVLASSNNSDKVNNISASDNTTIAGELFCSGEVELKGNVYGSVYAHSFYLRTEESEYQNALLNFQLNKLPYFFQKINIINVSGTRCQIVKKIE
ncbi:hypothetical protein [Tenacibaculum maritimum]|uniref:hypothetical protein n=1 Tax=Tenacibaculum maritimum TaxID=107401 RepID=UPI0010A51E19|nr:hypothetical protein [Tenacibaculum maritimum]MCD9583754.1 hypothetical protein [Tenacibaculum maritimum]MCD9619482.1 hypothetical protein [Tenacibaculum maritimum]MCD9626176.1 hypothetical protein [Tenacibaculum maritimum]MCD9629168.1 hypothetical protein [Tenacibaculum maritimum]MCD9631611.1 hypothetical protein [Tenacibaculum maritimum]